LLCKERVWWQSQHVKANVFSTHRVKEVKMNKKVMSTSLQVSAHPWNFRKVE